MEMGSMSSNNGIQEPMPAFDSFAGNCLDKFEIINSNIEKRMLKKMIEKNDYNCFSHNCCCW